MDRELDVASALDPERADDPEGGGPKGLVVRVAQRLGRGDHDRFARVDAHRIQVLHAADRDAVVRAVPHHLVLELLPAEDGFLHEDLFDPRIGQAKPHDSVEFRGIVRHAAPAASERVRGSDDHRVSGFLDERGRRRGVGHRPAPWDWLPDRPHEGGEALAVLARGDRLHLRPEQLHAVAAQDPGLGELAAQVQRGLSAHPAQDPLRPFLRDHLLEERDREGLHVHRIRGVGIRLNRRRIAVHQDDPHPFFPERPARLGTGVVELRGLADHDGPGADHHGGPNVLALGHRPTPVPRPTPP